MRRRVVGVELDRHLERGARLVELALGRIEGREVVVGLGQFREVLRQRVKAAMASVCLPSSVRITPRRKRICGSRGLPAM